MRKEPGVNRVVGQLKCTRSQLGTHKVSHLTEKSTKENAPEPKHSAQLAASCT